MRSCFDALRVKIRDEGLAGLCGLPQYEVRRIALALIDIYSGAWREDRRGAYRKAAHNLQTSTPNNSHRH
jgi:hypothetical protein